jgi:hypothetical protein
MGEIVIKVPGNNKQIFDLTRGNFVNELEKVDLLLKEIRQKRALELLNKLACTLPEDFKVSEEELHMQDD